MYCFIGYINCETKEFIHPISKERLSMEEAIERGYIIDNQTDADVAIESYKKKGAVMEYKSTKVSESPCYTV